MRRALLGVALVVLAATSRADDRSLAELVDALAGSDYRARLAARTELMRRKDPAVLGLLAARLPELDYAGRLYAGNVLDALPRQKTRDLYRSLLRGGDADLRALGAAGLWRQGDFAGIPVVARDLLDPEVEPTTLYHAILRIQTVRHPTLRAAVIERIGRPAPALVLMALLRHVSYTIDPAYRPVLEKLAGSDSIEGRLRARALLWLLGDTEVLTGLEEDLVDPAVTYAVLLDVLNWLPRGPEPPDSLKDAVLERLKTETNASAIGRLLGLLADWGHHPAIPVAEELIDSENATIARAAFDLVARLAGRGQTKAIRRGLESPITVVRILAAEALRRLDDESALPVVLEAYRTGDATDRREAARVLGGYRTRKVFPALLDAFLDEDPTVRSYAWSGIVGLLNALFPYRRFDWPPSPANAPPVERRRIATALRDWWKTVDGE